MITAERLRRCRGESGVLELLRELGYPVEPTAVDGREWERGGMTLPSGLRLVSRLDRFDVFLADANATEESITSFMHDYDRFNAVTKSVVIKADANSFSVYDRNGHARRLDVDCAAPSVHALSRLNLLDVRGEASRATILRAFDLALDRESVARRFFERFRDAVHDVSTALQETGESHDACDEQALLILSRLLFLCFIQEKGWLNGERRFLVDRLPQKNFYARVLQPLFFGCLNTPPPDRRPSARRLGRIPYLNGGLFEPSQFELRRPDHGLPDELLRRVLEEVFERFDFRVDERDTAGMQVDPEMLGKVFESLMAADERAASGSFYTPKEIVDVLTSRAVRAWLACDPETATQAEARRALERLEQIAVLDPACGSGAFLLSAASMIEKQIRALAHVADVEVPKDLRRRIIERSLFGVDLEPQAVRLCELRLWLAIVSATDGDDVAPLPNLDRNILQGNSLLSPLDFLGSGRGDIYHAWVHALRAQRDVIERYRVATRAERPALCRLMRENDRRLAVDLLARSIDADEAELQRLSVPQSDLFGRAVPPPAERWRELHERAEETRRTLARVEEGTLDFFSFDVHFATVMSRGGFDVVAGNPPWVRNSRIDPHAKRRYAERYALFGRGAAEDRAAFHQPDLSIVFFERALSLVSADGVVSMLMPAKLTNAAYAAPLRRHLEERTSIVAIDDWSDDPRRWFDADTFPLGVTVQKSPARTVAVHTAGERFDVAQRDLTLGSEWALVPPEVGRILRRLRKEHSPLAATLKRTPLMGVKTGDNRRFFLEAQRVDSRGLLTAEEILVPLSAVCRCVRGRDVRRWSAAASQWMLWPPPGGWGRRPPTWLRKLAALRGVDVAELRLSYLRPEHVGIKVAWKDLARGMTAAVLPDVVHVDARTFPLIPNQTLYSIDAVSLDEAYAIAAMLNSTIADALLLAVVERAKDAHFRYFARTVARLPLPKVDAASRTWELLVRGARRGELAELELLVAALYGVNDRELGVLRAFVAKRLRSDAR